MRLVLLLLLLAQSDEKQVEKALKEFDAAWGKARRDPDARIQALSKVSNLRHDKILDDLLKKLKDEEIKKVRAALIEAIRPYSDREKGARALAEHALAAFNEVWPKGDRVSAVTALTVLRHEIILDALIQKLGIEKEAAVKEALVGAIAQYTGSEKAARTLAEAIDKNDRLPSVMQKIFQGLGTIKPQYSRPYAAKVNTFVESKGKGKDTSYAVPAVNALGMIRHKSSVPVLITRLREAQKMMQEYIRGENLPGCNGD